MKEARFKNVISAIDAINSEDPNVEIDNGKEVPKELLYSERMTAMLHEFHPDPSASLLIAGRGQHIKRWVLPRDEFPMDRKGYLTWRTQLKKFHGDLVGSIMEQNGYGNEDIQKVDDLINKRRLKTDMEAQALEDVVCLVFLKHYFEEFMHKHDDDKLIGIVRKTWNKMSEKGHRAALKLQLSDKATDILNRALHEKTGEK